MRRHRRDPPVPAGPGGPRRTVGGAAGRPGAVVLATTTPDLPPGARSLEELLRPPPPVAWTRRHGVEQLRLLGAWLRRLHGTAPEMVPATAGVVPDAVQLAEEAGAWAGLGPLEDVHAASLQRWSARLVADGRLGHGRLALDRILACEAPAPARLVVDAAGGLATVHPAVDVGWVTGDLIALLHQARAAGEDPAPFERLLNAFSTGYRTSRPGNGPDALDVVRAAAIRLALRASSRTESDERSLALNVARHLVEHCWSVGGLERPASPPQSGDGTGW
ncbi:hypothetical protein [Nocardioides pantholopis]|uniref:hypothetical protein n=1 Tax=Nocardioides pantholopis TaxID=2483798 RepID=UPI000FDB74CC|nr:hypothetical protein [Nocardioides pantholopis]